MKRVWVMVVILLALGGCNTNESEEVAQEEEAITEVTVEETVPEERTIIEKTVIIEEPEPVSVQPEQAPAKVDQAPAKVEQAIGPANEQPVPNYQKSEPSPWVQGQMEWNAMTPEEKAAEAARNRQIAKHEAIADAWRIPSPPGAPPLQEAARAAYAAGDRTAGG